MNTQEVNSEMQAGHPIPSSEPPKEMPVMNIETAQTIIAQTLNQPTDEELKREERRQLLQALRIKSDTLVEPEQYTLSVDGVGFFALKDIHALKGKQKSGKSAALKWFAAAMMGGRQGRVESLLKEPCVLFLDTEQQAADVRLVLDEVKRMSEVSDDYLDAHLHLYTLRRLSYETLVSDTREIIGMVRPQVVIIDGLVDYVDSFNDEVASRQLVHELLLMCDEFECAIVNVLHENKALEDQNMRGHLGTVLAQKAGTVLQCQKRDDIITVTTSDARHGAMPQWSVTFDANGHLQPADELLQMRQREAQQKSLSQQKNFYAERHKQRRELALAILQEHGGRMKRADLTKAMRKVGNISSSTASRCLTSLTGTDIVEVNGIVKLKKYDEIPF